MLCYNINVASYSGFNYYPISFGWGGMADTLLESGGKLVFSS